MTATVLLLILVCILLETIEQVAFRQGRDGPRAKVYVAGGMALNLLGMAVWLLVLRHAPLGQAMPILAANNVTVALAGLWLFKERVSPKRWLGIALISAGVALVSTQST